jgi:hypothetical protein
VASALTSTAGHPDRTTAPSATASRRLPSVVPSAVVVLGLGALYAATVMRGVGGPTDTAKFQYLGSVLGTAHEPGYPLYTMLLALAVRLLPGVEDALVANALSAVCTIAAALLFLRVLQRLGVRSAVAVTMALALGTGREVWSQALIAEVYGLNLALVMAVLLFLVRWRQTHADRDLFLGLCIWALSFAHATSSVLLAPGILAFLVFSGVRAVLRPRLLLWLPALAAVALLPYGYILWRTLDPSTPYLEASFRNVPGLLGMVRGETFAGQMFAFSPYELLTTRLQLVWGLLRAQPLLWALIPAGIAVATRLREPVIWLLVIWGGATAAWGMNYDIADVEVVFIPAWACLLALAALGIESLLRRIRPAAGRGALLVGTAVVPVVTAIMTLPDVDASDDPTQDIVTAALAEVGPGGGVVTGYLYHHLNYYLIGPGEPKRPGVYSALPLPPSQLAEYCAGSSLGLGWNRVVPTAPPGLPLYVLEAPYIATLARQGVPLVHLSPELARVDCQALLGAPPG